MFYILSQDGMEIIPVSERDVILANVGYPKVNEFNIAIQDLEDYVNGHFAACYRMDVTAGTV